MLPRQPSLLLLLLLLSLEVVDVPVVLHGRRVLGVVAGDVWRMLWAAAGVLVEGAVLKGAACLVVALLLTESRIAVQRRAGAPAAEGQLVAFRADYRRDLTGAGGPATQ